MARKGQLILALLLLLGLFPNDTYEVVVFEQPSYSPNLVEEPDPGVLIVELTVFDIERSGNITFSIEDANFANDIVIFSNITSDSLNFSYNVNLLVGPGVTQSTFDYDERPTVVILIGATNNIGESAETRVTVNLIDVNDNAPVIQSRIISVREDEPVNSIIGEIEATDEDSGIFGIIAYQQQQPQSDVFMVQSNGDVILLRSLDYETQREYQITVIASDHGDDVMSSTAEVMIRVIDVNDRNPLFDFSSYSAEVYENRSMESVILQVSARDGDEGINDTIIYSISSTEPSGPFIINSSTGHIILSGSLDREDTSSYNFRVMATEMMAMNSHNSTTIQITVLDINDNYPMFTDQYYNRSINETTSVGSTILTVTAPDNDVGENARTIFSIINQSVPFMIRTSELNVSVGVIVVDERLDYETQEMYTFEVMAQDSSDVIGSGSFQSTATITINLININDEYPQFLNAPYEVMIMEHSDNGSVVVMLNVTDRDIGPGGVVEVGITNHEDVFEIANDFEIVVKNSSLLDHETTPQYLINVVATDMGTPPLSTTGAVVVNVINDNDNVPIVYCQPVEVMEDLDQGLEITTINASDADGDALEFMINENESRPINVEQFFNFSGNRLVASSTPIDYEKYTELVLSITVTDGDPDHVSDCLLNITVIDINDNSPVINEPRHFLVREDAEIGEVIGTVNATDKDSEEFGIINYFLSNGSRFTINITTGELYVNRLLDYEEVQKWYIVVVMVIDYPGGEMGDRLSNVSVINITLVDVNDNRPVFSQSEYRVTVDENEEVFNYTGVRATDRDTGSNADLTFDIQSSNINGSINDLLMIDPSTGFISKIGSGNFDRETLGNISLTVIAYDNGSPRLNSTAQVLIILQDVNDNPPEFNQRNYNFSVFENASIGDIVDTVSATDIDEGPVSYKLNSTQDVPFRLDTNTGGIFVDELLDRETLSFYTLHVVASDGLNDSFAVVYINVLDVNDNPPEFTNRLYRRNVPENVMIGSSIISITATDRDIAPNNIICYSILAEDMLSTPNEITINNRSGEISVIARLDYDQEDFEPTIVTYVYATDSPDCDENDESYFTDFVTFLLTVTDVNDNCPQFMGTESSTNSSFMAAVSEGSGMADQFNTNITVTDADEGEFGRVMVTTNSTDFAVRLSDQDLLIIEILTELDREIMDNYIIFVNATDGGGCSTYIDLTITLVDVNEYPPVFNSSDGYVTNILEGNYSQPHVAFTGILAEDMETDGRAIILYRLQEPHLPFSINATSGVVTVSGTIDRETNSSFNLTVIAYEEGDQSSNTTLTIIVDDVNDNDPVISSCSNDSVPETDIIGTPLLTVIASDDDEGKLLYSIEDPNNIFSINNATGVITNNQMLDYEGVRMFNFTVTVSDTMNNISKYCSIALSDVNDNAPQFVEGCCNNVSISENTAVGTLLDTVINVTDADSGDNGKVKLWPRFFFIDKFQLLENGSINVTGMLDYETQSEYTLLIIASDMALPPLTSNITIVVELKNENDNDPSFDSSIYEFVMNEHSPNGTIVGQVTATDADGDPVSLSVVNGPFLVDSNGSVTSNGDINFFDYDVPPINYHFTILATDEDENERTDTAYVVVSIMDVNDNPPVFIQYYNTTLASGTYTSQPLLALVALDDDSSGNGLISYNIQSDSSGGMFQMDNVTGLLTVNGSFNMNMMYTLTVLAMDQGDPPRSDTTIVTVNVVDTDAHFSNASYSVSIYENISNADEIEMFILEGIAAQEYFLATNISQFMINTNTGALTLASSLDYETDAQWYVFTVGAISMTSSTALAMVTINLLDVNDNAPVFIDSGDVQAYVEEDSPVNTTVYTLSTVDADSPINSNTGYVILPSNVSSLFSITRQGQLLLNESLDHEASVTQYPLTVMAYDIDVPSLNNTINITINVLDSNDHNPVFTQPFYTASINEAASNGSRVVTIMATDQDNDVNGDIFFTIIDGDTGGHFVIASTKSCEGTIYTTGNPTDRELSPVINLTIQASDRGSIPRTNNTTVIITLLDINDNAPVLNTVGPFNVTEDVSTGIILTLSANDEDLPDNGYGVVNYSLDENENFNGLFSINDTTGELIISSTLDRETVDVYNLTVILRDMPDDGSQVNSDTFNVIINVLDVNDNDPQFEPVTMPLRINENGTIGTVVVTLTATDDDEGSNANIIISIVSVSPRNHSFRIDPINIIGMANLIVDSELDRELIPLYIIVVKATDMGNPVRSSTMTLNVLVTDVNDNPPFFIMSQFSFTVREDASIGTTVNTLSAIDLDDTSLRYGYEYDVLQFFSINETNGVISVADTLDRETNSSYHFVARVSDGIREDTAEVMITVMDVNDNRPQFTNQTYIGMIEEGSLPTRPVRINPVIAAIDNDQMNTPNSRVIYSLVNNDQEEDPSDYFDINPTTALVVVSLEGHNRLDHENATYYNLTVQAVDAGNPSLTGTAILIIDIIDVNDNAPMFDRSEFTVEVIEEQPFNGTLRLPLIVTANDLDDEVVNGAISYSISDGSTDVFALNNETGQLFAISRIDAEEEDFYNLTVVARDGSPPFHSASASIIIRVHDINDNTPQFNASVFLASVDEIADGEPMVEQYVTTLGITDIDRGTDNSSLTINVLSDKFLINTENHRLFTSSSSILDREISPTEEFLVMACDQGVEQRCSNVTVVVTLLDVNDNDPQFDQPNYTLTIRQLQPMGSTVGVFIAQDEDIGNNGELRYSLHSNVTEEIFRIDNISGSLILNQHISPEFINSSIELIITASDQGVPSRSGYVTVIVMILGELGVVPVFNQSVYNVSIIEGMEPGTHVVTVSASSTLPNIEYFIEPQLADFAIDTNQGVISTAVRLSRDNAVSYSFSVRAFNGVASGFSLVVVTVNDSNDHSPQFENLPYLFDVVENNERNELIGQIVATDQDSGSNAELRYTIIQGNENNLFYVHPSNGSLYANESFDREMMSTDITITVMVTDMGMAPLNATTTVTIAILDENDNSPMIRNITVISGAHMLLTENNSVIVIPENHPPYTPFIRFDVFDPDEGRNGDFVYSFQSNSDNFVIDRHLGSLQNVRELDYDESRTSFSLTIVIMDRGRQPRSIEHYVTVNVSDVNDCTPDFDSTSESFVLINEELPHGTSIANFTATDCDSGNNSVIQYSITRGNEDGDFSISNGGHLTANVVLDREKVSEYTLVITAADLGVPSLNSSIELTIELSDIDDNAPQFETLSQTVTVSENIPLSSIIATVNAIDPDTTSVIRYMIASNVFAISSTGEVTLMALLDREMLDQYNVTITATDDTNSNYSQLIVDVLDVNDNSPVFVVDNSSVTDTCQVVVSVPEHVNNSMVYQLTATDADEGVNSEIVYSFLISQDSNSFILNNNTGQIRTRGSLDHEIQSIYTLPVRAEDQAIMQRRETGCTVIVQVEDINDNPPQFLQDVYFGSVSENINDVNILTVSATDEDATSVNNLIQYKFSDDLGIFSIHPDSGVIRNLVPLDRENVSDYNMTVIGINTAGTPSLNDTTTVMITVLDENEFAPAFVSPPDSVNVSEIDMASNELILQLTAIDMDDNPNVVFTYSLLTRISNSPFSLGSADGRLSLTGTLDFEDRSQYNLTFEISDGERSSNTNIIVEVIDENDNAPYFDNVDADDYIHASVLEGESDVVFTRLFVNDDDTDEVNTDSMIQLVSAFGVTNNTEALDHFELDPLTGDIKVAANMSLDREENEFFILNFTVNNTRPGVNCAINPDSCNLISAAELLVTVNDTNDNPPVFTSSVYNGDITTTVGVGQIVVRVEATDKDELFGPIIYELSIETGKALNFFGIDKTSGEVVTQASFLDSVGENFTFTVVAKDNGGIPFYQSSEATVTVIVLDNLQRVVITFQCHQSLIVPQANKIRSALENITGYFITLETVEPHYERDRTTGERLTSNANLTDFVFYAVDRTTNKIVEGEDVIRVLINSISLLEGVLDDGCKVQSAQAVQELLMASRQELASVQVVLIILAGIIGSGGLLMLCLAYRQRYVGRKQKNDRYRADVFFGPGDALEDIERHKITTRTENYEMIGEPITHNQPMIVQPYQDWNQPATNVEKRSDATKQALRNDNPLYESQEIRMEMFADMSETDFSEEDEAGLLAAAIADEDDEEDVDELVTAI